MVTKYARPLGAGVVIPRLTSTFNKTRQYKQCANDPLNSLHHYVRLRGRNKRLVVSQSSMASSSSSCGVRGSFRLASLTDRSELKRQPGMVC